MTRTKPSIWILSCISLGVLTILTIPFPLFSQFVYVVNGFSNNVSGYSINATTGVLTPIPGSPFAAGSSPLSVAVDPTGKFAYVANFGDNTVSGYTVDPTTGALTAIPGSPFATGEHPKAVVADPTAKFTYATIAIDETSPGTVSGYTINPTTGALTPIPGSPFAAGLFPFSAAVDPTGKFAYVANVVDNTVSGYTINATTGVLTPIPGSPFATGTEPSGVVVDPTGKFVYVASPSPSISGYSINPTTGALTPIPGSPFPAAGTAMPSGLAVDPTGKFAYVADEDTPGTVSGYTIDATTGALTLMPESFPAGAVPVSVAVDATGKFAYVVNSFGVSGYTIDASTGALTPIPGSPFPAGQSAGSIATTPLLTLQVQIDIKPGEDPPTINPNSHGKIPVAILSSAAFNAPAEVASTSLTFGRTGDEPSLAFCNPNGEDVNGDGLPDLVCHFDTLRTKFRSSDTVGVLKGKSVTNVPIRGTDSIIVK